jgi:hypothetical protein
MTSPRQATHEMLARGVRVHLISYAKVLRSALDAGVPVQTLMSWGIPWHDIQAAQLAVRPLGVSTTDDDPSKITQPSHNRDEAVRDA